MCAILSPQAQSYAWRQLAQRVGVVGGDPLGTGFESLNLPVRYARPSSVCLERPGIIVAPCAHEWDRDDGYNTGALDWLSIKDVMPPNSRPRSFWFSEEMIPVLFWGERYGRDGSRFVERRRDGSLVFYVDIIASIFFMLSRWEETKTSVLDEHGRFPAVASVAHKHGFLDRPLVDEYALIVREWLKVILPGWKPKKRRFSVRVTHDIDKVLHFSGAQSAFRTIGGDLMRRRSLREATRNVARFAVQTLSPRKDHCLHGIYDLADILGEAGLDGAFYFMAAEKAPFDDGYDPGKRVVRKAIGHLRERGFEVGLHAGYHTFDNPERLAMEKARLDNILGETRYGGRQHYLRFKVPDTWRHWEQVGLTYDSTMGYPDHEGFRCGTCHPFRPFDVERDREFDLVELPLIVMDGTLRFYRRMTPEQGKKRILELAQRCKRVEGEFTLLWHNTSLYDDWQPWSVMYKQVLLELKRMEE